MSTASSAAACLPRRQSFRYASIRINTGGVRSPRLWAHRDHHRPGTEQWHGSIAFNLRNSALDARNAFATTKPEFNSDRYLVPSADRSCEEDVVLRHCRASRRKQ
jgi:hypothetical protein